MFADALPAPRIEQRAFGELNVLTDNALADAVGVRIAFSTREGGVSAGSFASLNLGGHVHDDAAAVEENRARLLASLGGSDMRLLVPRQVHGDRIVRIDSHGESELARVRDQAGQGADGLLVTTSGVAALLCFADCVPVVLVSPTGAFCVVHAGWRGVVAHIAVRGAQMLAASDAQRFGVDPAQMIGQFNVYIGPCIRRECFEVGAEVRDTFAAAFGDACIPDERHVDLPMALACDLARCGISAARIADAHRCTMCESDVFFSYRATQGSCGRHGAIAFRRDEVQ